MDNPTTPGEDKLAEIVEWARNEAEERRKWGHSFVAEKLERILAAIAQLQDERDSFRVSILETQKACAEAEKKLIEVTRSKDGAYSERDQLVAALSKFFPASLERHEDTDLTWENDWRWIVFIDLPTGQASWHIHDSELPLFSHLKRLQGRKWDGHNNERKYERLAALSALAVGELPEDVQAVLNWITPGEFTLDTDTGAKVGAYVTYEDRFSEAHKIDETDARTNASLRIMREYITRLHKSL